ncbi:MAG TPA: hypothetical protein VIL48_08085 [Acidimicrobiales bacterium]
MDAHVTESTRSTDPPLAKASFDHIYDEPDPRNYFRTLGAHDYAVPHYGQQVFRRLLDAMPAERPTVVDLCCSYGVNAALLKTDLGLRDLYDHYRSDELTDLTPAELAEVDRQFYAAARTDAAPAVIGLDTAGNAVDYAVEVGLLDEGMVENLEDGDPSTQLAKAVGTADLVTVTGGIGYITDKTFDRVLDCADERPWVASLCLRTVPFEPIAECLARQGLVTEQLDGVTFPQRRFASEEERAYALRELDALGIEPAGRESEGCYHVNVYLSRPPEAAADAPIDEILGGLPDPPHTPVC